MPKHFSKSLGKRTHSNPNARISTFSEEEGLKFLDDYEGIPFLLILDQVQDPRNLGACLRTADAAGVTMVIIPADRSAGITEVVRHVAAGAAESLKLMRVRNLSRLMKELKMRGIRL